MPDNREAALVKFGGKAQYMPMVYGLIKRMRNSGEVKKVNAHCVYSKDEFDYAIENGVERVIHKPKLDGDRGEFVLAYAVIILADDTPHIEVMMKADIEKARKTSATQKGNGPTGVWAAWYEEMSKKTVIHRASKRVPTSSDVEKLLANDMRVTLHGDNAEVPTEKSPSLIDNINSAISGVLEIEHQTAEETSDLGEWQHAIDALVPGLNAVKSNAALSAFLNDNAPAIEELTTHAPEAAKTAWEALVNNKVSALRGSKQQPQQAGA